MLNNYYYFISHTAKRDVSSGHKSLPGGVVECVSQASLVPLTLRTSAVPRLLSRSSLFTTCQHPLMRTIKAHTSSPLIKVRCPPDSRGMKLSLVKSAFHQLFTSVIHLTNSTATTLLPCFLLATCPLTLVLPQFSDSILNHPMFCHMYIHSFTRLS